MYIFGVWMGSLDRKQKRCCNSSISSLLGPFSEDRLTSLPDELVTRILSMLPTKDAATAQVLSKKMRRAFCWITSIDLDNSHVIPIICLPNLKLLQLRSFVFTEDDFLTRLVSNCPVLEDLSITSCWWLKANRLIITSNSLRRFVFNILKYDNEEENSEVVHIDTPNLQYFEYSDNLAFNYIAHFNALVEASIEVVNLLQFDTLETSYRIQLSFVRALSNVQHLTLHRSSFEGFYYAAKLKVPLPMFRNLKTLKLAALCYSYCSARWDILLWLILHRSPLLEELVFLEGFFLDGEETCDYCYHNPDNSDVVAAVAALEAAFWGIDEVIPSCCESHLKRIQIDRCWGLEKELKLIRFLLGNASFLKEFVIFQSKPHNGARFDVPSFDQFKKALEEIPRASNSCSIIYLDEEPAFN